MQTKESMGPLRGYVDTFEEEDPPDPSWRITELSNLKPMYLFVYGTLMKGEYNHNVMPSGSKFLGVTETKPGFELLDVGLPAMRRAEGSPGVVVGEVYEINGSILARLDLFEGHPIFYRREMIQLEGAVPEAWAYLRDPSHGIPLPSPASWLKRRRGE